MSDILESTVILECQKQGSKLRIRIISPGYNNYANCRFPKAIREEGRRYSVPSHAISFNEGSNMKFFYMIKPSLITILKPDEDVTELLAKTLSKTSISEKKVLKIYEDVSIESCVVCFDREKDVVFAPCGHYCSCFECASIIKRSNNKCPICRSLIKTIVKRDQIDI